MGLENVKRKLDAEKQQKENSPFRRTVISVGKDGKLQIVTERISRKEWLEDQEEYEDNPEDPDFRAEMEGTND